MSEDPSWGDRWSSRPRGVTVTLECSHRVKTRMTPTDGAHFACPNNSGCGYNVEWLTAEDEAGRIFKNKRHRDNQEEPDEPERGQ